MYKFTLQPTEIKLTDPTAPGEPKPNFIQKGLTYTEFPTKVKNIGSTALYNPGTNSGLDSNQKELYEKELEEILKNYIENVEEVIVFDHVIRSSKNAGKACPHSLSLSNLKENHQRKAVIKMNITKGQLVSNVLLVSSNLPKKQRNFIRSFALAFRKRSNKKIRAQYTSNNWMVLLRPKLGQTSLKKNL